MGMEMEENEQVNPVESVTIPEKSGGLSFAGLIQVFTAPGQFFEKLKDNPKILVPYIVVGAMTLTFLFMAGDIIVKMQLDQMAKNPNLSATQMPSAGVMKGMTIAGGMFAILLVPILAAGLALFFGNFVLAGKVKFKQVLSVMLYGEVVFMLGGLITLPLILAKDSLQVSFSLAMFAIDQPIDSVMYVALSKIALFQIWEIIVIGIGLSKLYNVPSNKGYLLSVLSMGLLPVIQVLTTIVSKAISG